MAYSDPTTFVGGTNGVHYDTNVKEANLQHIVVTDSTGAERDYIIVEGTGSAGTEIWSIASDGTMVLETTIATQHVEPGDHDDFTVMVDGNGDTHLIDTGRDGMSSIKWDSSTDSWSYSFQANTDFFAAGQVKLDVFKADDGTIYGYAGSTSSSGGAGTNIIEQYVYDPVTQTFDTANPTTYSPTADLGKQFNSTWAEGFETGEMEVLMTNDGPKLLQWNDGGVSRVEGFTLYDIDPATGDLVEGSASSYNFGTQAEVDNFGQEIEFVNDSASDELIFNQQTSTIEVDVNGNIVMTTGTWGTSEHDSYGLIVIDPRLSLPDSADATQDGDGDVDNSASVIAAYEESGSQTSGGTTIPATYWGSNAEITYSPDGAYMYITSENTTGSLDTVNTQTIIVDTSTYEIVDFGTDTTAGYYSTDTTNNDATTYNKGAMSQIIVTLSTGEQYYLGQYSDEANATTGWLSVAEVTADVVTEPPTSDGIVDGAETGESMALGYTDAEGDQITTGNDSILGNGGDDTIDGDAGNDTIDGGADNDSITGGDGDDSVLGGTGSDTLAGGEGQDTLDGGAGDDDIAVGGADSALGGTGDDVFTVDPTDPATDVAAVIDGGSDGTDGNPDGTENGDAGDVLDLSGETGDLEVTLGTDPEDGTVDGLDTISGDDDITFSEIEAIETGTGDDTIDGSASTGPIDVATNGGNDSVIGGSGDDTIDGGDGSDTLEGGLGSDSLIGGGGDDDLIVGSGDTASGGTGDDEFILDPTNTDGPGTITIDGGSDGTSGAPEDGANGDAGDILDFSGLDNVTIVSPLVDDGTGSFSGAVSYTNDQGETITVNFSEIENVTIPDYVVEGTSAGELIDVNYTGDPDGDMVDNNDHSDGSNNDSIDAGEGDDTIIAGDGDDTVRADEGDDVVEGGAGNDSIFGFEGSDTVDGGDGDDFINTRTSPGTGTPDVGLIHPDNPLLSYPADVAGVPNGSGGFFGGPDDDRDSVDGGAGNDTILTGDDDDTIIGGAGNDIIDAGFDDDTVQGGTGADSIQGSEGADTIDGGDDDDVIYGGVSPLDPNYTIAQNYDLEDAGVNTSADPVTGNNSDFLLGGSGNDRLYGQDDADTLEGGTGNDTLDGGIDDDSLVGGTGDDELTGGQGDDVFVIADPGLGDGDDTITDFGDGITGPISDDDQTNNDFVDLTAYYNQTNYDAAVAAGDIDPLVIKNPLEWLRADQADDGVLNDTNAGWTATDTLTIQNGGSAVAGSELNYDTTGVICFVRGTHIATADGEKPVEALQVGDRIVTRDSGYRKVRWIGATKREAVGLLAPVMFKAGSIGNHTDLLVSPNHRMLLKDAAVELWTGDREVLVPAKFMVNGDDIVSVEGGFVEYYHILFDNHEIILSEGAWSESFHPGHVGCEDTRKEILDLFPELEDMQNIEGWVIARKVLNRKEATVILSDRQ